MNNLNLDDKVMAVDLRKFFEATDPSRTLVINNTQDKKYYIDFSSVRGGDIIGKLKQKIAFFKPHDPTCTLFTGHIGCGKSTELLRLQLELEADGFHVIYFESSEDLEMTDIDIADVLLAIAKRCRLPTAVRPSCQSKFRGILA